MIRALCALGASLLGVAGIAACSKAPPSAEQVTSASAAPNSAAPPATLTSAPPTRVSSAPPAAAAKPACRALVVTGDVKVEGSPVLVSSMLDGEHWAELAPNSSLSLRHSASSREFKLIGPGRFLPCRNGTEQILLAAGRLATSANLGVRPGAEVLIATPVGSVRYGDAALEVELGAQGLSVRVKEGEAWVEPAQGSAPFPNPVHSGAAHLPAQHMTARALVAACEASADAAATSAARVLTSGSAGGESSLGDRAALHMRARARARIACAIAAAAAFAASDPAERLPLSASVAHADELWQSVPRASSGQKN